MSFDLFLSLDAEILAFEEAPAEHGAHVAPRGRKSADVVEAHQPPQGKRVLDKLVFERRILGVLDRKGELELTELEIQLVERPVTHVGIDDLRRRELDLHPVVEFRSDGARQVQADALDEKGRRALRPLVTRLHVSRNLGQAGQYPVPCRGFGLQSLDLGRKFRNGGLDGRLLSPGPEEKQEKQSRKNLSHKQRFEFGTKFGISSLPVNTRKYLKRAGSLRPLP